jgi:hypothetical protein
VAKPSTGQGALLDPIRPTGVRPTFVDKLKAARVNLSPDLFDPIPVADRLAAVNGRRAR